MIERKKERERERERRQTERERGGEKDREREREDRQTERERERKIERQREREFRTSCVSVIPSGIATSGISLAALPVLGKTIKSTLSNISFISLIAYVRTR